MNRLNQLSKGYVLVICEGQAEAFIMDCLIDHGLLLFSRQRMVDQKVIKTRKANFIEEDYLNLDYGDDGLTLLRVLDSRRENFKLSKPYRNRFEVINVYTRPEIEILAIIKEGHYATYKNSRGQKKPSQYCKETLGLRDVKRRVFWENYFSNPEHLVSCLKTYHRLTKTKQEWTLYDLIDQSRL